MNELNRPTKQKKTEISNAKNHHNTTKAKSNLPSSPTLWNQNKYDLGVWSKTKFTTKYNLDNNQYPILMVDKIPSPIDIPPKEIKLSTQSTIFDITTEKNIEEKLIILMIFYLSGIIQRLKKKEKKRYRKLGNKRNQIT